MSAHVAQDPQLSDISPPDVVGFDTVRTESAQLPLCVDLDGTLIKSDTLLESTLALLRANPLCLFLLPRWLLKGRAHLKAQVTSRAEIRVDLLPYNLLLFDYLLQQQRAGRPLILVTAANRHIASQVARHVGLFDEVYASDEKLNLKGESKARLLEELYGRGNFDYAGDSSADVAVWRVARAAVVVNPASGVEASARRLTREVRLIDDRVGFVRPLLQALRVHQWLKNLLLFMPLFAAHALNIAALQSAVLAFIAFGACASGVYILNDLFDLPTDRLHIRKRNRPFASGALPLSLGLAAIPALLAFCALVCSLLPPAFGFFMLAYLGVTTAYSFRLKRIALVDVFVLAGLYTLRVVAGAAAIEVEASFWLLAFSMFVFLSLALVKRSAELSEQIRRNKTQSDGRGYRTLDHEYLHSMGVASGYLAVLVVALYINNPGVTALYSRPQVLWLLCPLLLYWVSRMWLKAGRGEMHDDPLVFAALDPVSHKVFGAGCLTVVAAIW